MADEWRYLIAPLLQPLVLWPAFTCFCLGLTLGMLLDRWLGRVIEEKANERVPFPVKDSGERP